MGILAYVVHPDSQASTYDFTGKNVTLLKTYPETNFMDFPSMFFGFSAPEIGGVLMKTFSKGSFTRL